MPYLYIWIHIPTGKFYIGSRTTFGAHINDGYTCSSEVVFNEIQQNKKDWIRVILKQDTKENILTLEKTILEILDVINNPDCLNQTNYSGRVIFKSINTKRTEPLKYFYISRNNK
jgi:hypothetical protein